MPESFLSQSAKDLGFTGLDSLNKVYLSKDVSGVYFLFAGDSLMFIGATERCHSIIESKAKVYNFDSYAIFQHDDPNALLPILILMFKPMENRQLPTHEFLTKQSAKRQYGLRAASFALLAEKDNICFRGNCYVPIQRVKDYLELGGE